MTLDVHYQFFTKDGNRCQVTAFGAAPPARQQMNITDDPDKPVWAELVSAHTSWGPNSSNMEHSWRTGCFVYDPKFDDEEDDDDDPEDDLSRRGGAEEELDEL